MPLLQLIASLQILSLISAPAQEEEIAADGNGKAPQLESIDTDYRP